MSTDGSTRLTVEDASGKLRVLGMMGAEPADGQQAKESLSDLRLLSVSYKISGYHDAQGSWTLGGEAHVGPEDDPEDVYLRLRRWLHENSPLDAVDLERSEQETLDLREQIRKQQENLTMLQERVRMFERFMSHWMIPWPEGMYEELQDLPF